MLSVIIPTRNAGRHLKCCLAAVEGAGEVIVVDGGSSDDSVAIAESGGARVIRAPANRGGQLGAGAAAAAGDWLLFLHADTIPGPGWREAVKAHVAAHPDQAGCLVLRLDDPAWQARLVEAAVALRVRAFALPYGDQGLLISRAHYAAVGGFRALPLMEDVDIVRRIGRRNLRLLPAVALTSAERWRSDGWLRRSARNLACLVAWRLGASPRRIARLYR